MAREEKRKSKEVKADSTQPWMPDRLPTRNPPPEVESGPHPDQEFTPRNVHVVAHQNSSIGEGVVDAASTIETPSVPDTHKSKQSKAVTRAPFTSMKGDRGIKRFFAKFKRKPKDEKSFTGGAALIHTTSKPTPTGPHEYDSSTISSLLESDMEEHDEDGERPDNSVSGVTEGSEEFEEARDVFDEGLAPAPTFVASNPVRDTRFHEEL